MGYASTGQLTYSQFELGLQLFVEWWDSAVSAALTSAAAAGGGGGGCPCWEFRHIKLPVTDQVACYCELERVITVRSSETAAALDPLGVAARKDGAVASSDAAAAAVQAAADGDAASAAEMGTAVVQVDTAAAVSGLPPAAAEMDAAVVRRDAAAVAADSAAATPATAEGDAAAAAAITTHAPHHIHQYSIVWHEVYQVPVLYIRAFTPDGRCLSMDDLMIDLPGLKDSREPDQADWTFLTAVEHPLTRSPYYMLHPCQTAERMTLMMQHDSSLTAADTAADTAGIFSSAPVRHSSECSSCRDSIGGRKEGGAAARETGLAASDGIVPAEPAAVVAKEELLWYMRCWFSLVAGVLGFSMVRHRFW